MGRAPCCDKANVKRGPWSPEEDAKLKDYINNFGIGGNWIALPLKAGLKRCGKSCRLRWLNYLRPNIKHGEFSNEEDRVICSLFASIGSRWSIIAAQLPGRTDNDIKNYWNTKLKKKLIGSNINNNMIISSSTISQNNIKKYHNINHNYNNNPMISSILSPYEYTMSFNNNNNNDNNSTLLHSNLPMQVKDNSTLLIFGHDQAATSSEGSCSIKCENRSYSNNNYGFPNTIVDRVHREEDEKPSLINNAELWGQIIHEGSINNNINNTILDNYGLEEIKELISSTNNNNNNNTNNNNNDSNMMMYYY